MDAEVREVTDAPGVLKDVEVSNPREGVAVVALLGEHDLLSEEQVEALFSNLVASNKLVVVDVSEAQFIDSSLLHNLVKADQQARTNGDRFVPQLGTAPIVKKALEVSGLLNLLDCASSREEALAKMKPC